MSYTSDVAATDSVLDTQYNNLRAEMAMTASIAIYGDTSAPTGWLLCDGSAVSRTTYSDLFAIVGTTYGSGDGSTTFNVPDCQGRVVVCKGTTYSLGMTGGNSTITITEAQMAAHTHSITSDGSHGHGNFDTRSSAGATTYYRATGTYAAGIPTTFFDHSHGGATALAGSGTAIDLDVSYQVFNFIIKW